jgi:hypothetical protein
MTTSIACPICRAPAGIACAPTTSDSHWGTGYTHDRRRQSENFIDHKAEKPCGCRRNELCKTCL